MEPTKAHAMVLEVSESRDKGKHGGEHRYGSMKSRIVLIKIELFVKSDTK